MVLYWSYIKPQICSLYSLLKLSDCFFTSNTKFLFCFYQYFNRWLNDRLYSISFILSGNVLNSINRTHFRRCEKYSFFSKFYSHNFNEPGLRYKLLLKLSEDTILWKIDPFHCGTFPDQNIFRGNLKTKLSHGDGVICEKRYSSVNCGTAANIALSAISDNNLDICQRARARHECLNSVSKYFSILHHIFRRHLHRNRRTCCFCPKFDTVYAEKWWSAFLSVTKFVCKIFLKVVIWSINFSLNPVLSAKLN